MATGFGQHRGSAWLDPMLPVGKLRHRVWLGVALAAVYLPHLIAYAGNLTLREHYQFFPLAWLGVIVLVWTRRDDLRRRDVRVPLAGWGAVVAAVLMLVGAGVLASSWLAAASIPLMVLGLAWLVGGWATARATIPALILFATTIRPPGTIDLVLVGGLRSLAVRISSRVLDVLGVVHVPLSNVLRVSGGDLLVDEACSGVNSLVSIVAVVLFLGLLARRPPIHLALLLIWSVGVVILANVGRVTIVTVAFARYGIDLVHGWRHEALGVALYGVSLGLVASLDQLFLLFQPLFHRRRASSSAAVPDGAKSINTPATGGPGPRQWTALAVALGAIVLILPVRWARGIHAPEPSATEVARLVRRCQDTLDERTLPAELAGWRRTGYKTEQRQRDNPFGQFSSRWEYRLGDRTASVCVDYPFVGWHELLICYSGINWTARQRGVERAPVDQGAEPALAYVVAALDNGTGEHATLRYSLVADDGRWVDPPLERGLGLVSRDLPWEAVPTRPEAQIQLFSSGFRPPGDEERRRQDDLFRAAAGELQRRLSPSEATRS